MIQQIYDSHYQGAKQAADFVLQWKSLENHVPADSYADALKRLEYQGWACDCLARRDLRLVL